MDLNFRLHPCQSEVFNSGARFDVVAAGRRFGKTFYAKIKIITEAMKVESEEGARLDMGDCNVAYIAPTFKQARQIMWGPLLNALAPMKPSASETDGVIRLPNSRKIYISGADNYDNLRGNKFSYVVLDEFAQMNPQIWEYVLRPALMDVKGGALFIGTPEGKNHFYDLFLKAQQTEGWSAFQFESTDNPYMPKSEITDISLDMSSEAQAQELKASFTAGGGMKFKDEWIQCLPKYPGDDGEIYMTVDLSGFETVKKRHGKTLDDTAIAVVEVGSAGWYVHDIITGRWDVRETAIRILRAAQVYKPRVIGIEKGPLKQAVAPYMVDNMKRLNVFPAIAECTHGSKNKQGRIEWALQGRLEQGRLTFKDGAYIKKFREQAADFPNPMAHDDMLDALAYVDQVAVANYMGEDAVTNDFEFLDDVAGY
jgi:hypothetical protein